LAAPVNVNEIVPVCEAVRPATNWTDTLSDADPLPEAGETTSQGTFEAAVHVTVAGPACVSRTICAPVCDVNAAPVVTAPYATFTRSSATVVGVVTASDRSREEEHPLLASVALTVIGKFPVCVGVPERTPALKVIPAGSVPKCANVTMPRAPGAVKVVEYGTPVAPPLNTVGAITGHDTYTFRIDWTTDSVPLWVPVA
jgi:hypothetical protein